MCLYLKEDNKRVAEEDIKVWKLLSSATTVNANSYYSEYEYIRNRIQLSPLNISTYYNGVSKYKYIIFYAFHSYSFDIKITSYRNICYRVGNNLLNHTSYFKWKSQYAGLFIIPKGASYYLEEDTYASDAIKYTGRFRKINSIKDYRKFIKQYSK